MTLLDDLERDEGRERFPYQDAKGKWTIGVGRNLSDRGLTEDEIDYLLGNDIAEARTDLQTFRWFDLLNDARRNVLLNMRFNLGATKFRKFKKMLAALEQGDYDTAADEMLDSDWQKQVKSRAIRLARIMRNGVLVTLFCMIPALASAQTIRFEWTQAAPSNPQGLTYRVYYDTGASLVLGVTCVPVAVAFICSGVAVEPPGWTTASMTVAETWRGESLRSDPIIQGRPATPQNLRIV